MFNAASVVWCAVAWFASTLSSSETQRALQSASSRAHASASLMALVDSQARQAWLMPSSSTLRVRESANSRACCSQGNIQVMGGDEMKAHA